MHAFVKQLKHFLLPEASQALDCLSAANMLEAVQMTKNCGKREIEPGAMGTTG